MSVNQKLRRLSVRGKIDLRLDMEHLVSRRWADIEYHPPRWPHGPARYSKWVGHTSYNEVPSPIWRVTIEKFSRRYPPGTKTRIEAYVWDTLLGENREYAEGIDLEAVLDELLRKTRPKNVDPMFDYCPGQFIPEEVSA